MSLARYRAGALRRLRRSRALLAAGRAASLPVVWRSDLFDRSWYEAQAGVRFPHRAAAVLHYLRRGSPDGLSPCRLFEAEWYQPERWRTAPLDPLAHLHLRGRPDAQPHPLLDPRALRRADPTAPTGPAAAVGHFLRTADPGTPMPVAAPGATASPATAPFLGLVVPPGAVPATWGELVAAQDAAVAEHAAQERLRTAPRTSPRHDAAADAAELAAWAEVPTPLPSADERGEPVPLVSVVMPVRDRAGVVGAAVASVLAQSLGSWELLVVDDGSRDGSADAVRAVAGGDPRVHVLAGPSRGVAAARNAALVRARGRWVAFLDSDNAWTPHFLRTAVTALDARDRRAAYAVARVVRPSGDVYRDLDAQADHLAVRNHVDLNVLVVERALLAEVGPFDEGLRRTVDYDLDWRIARRAPLLHLPFTGVVYDDDRTGDRLSTRERASWKEVVRREHLVDWDAARAAPRAPRRTSVLVTAREGWTGTWRTALALLPVAAAGGRGGGEEDVELVVVDAGGRPSTGRLLAVLALVEPRLRVLRTPDDVGPALGADLALARSSGDAVLLLAEDAEPAPSTPRRLREALQPGVAAVEALLTDWRDVVAAVGMGRERGGGPPERLLADLPREDARRLGEVVDVPALTGQALLARAADVLAVRGADPLLSGGLWGVDLALRLSALRQGALRVVTSAEVAVGTRVRATRGPAPRPPASPAEAAADLAELERRHGQVLAGWPAATAALLERGDPGRRRARILHEPLPRLRWAVQTATPAGADGQDWGDLHFGRALAEALEGLGQEVVVDNRASLGRSSGALDDVVLSVRGKVPLAPRAGAVGLLWVISHPDLVRRAEIEGHDAVFAASTTWRADDPRVEVLLQATDPARFHPGAPLEEERHDVLFVGNSRAVYRPVVRALVEAGADVAVYGGGWEPFLPPGVLRGARVENARLASAYRSAGLVLNDHWEDMRREGFASNRLFDAAAAGARVVSDHVEGLDAVFGPLVRTCRTPAELLDVVREGPGAYPDDEERRSLGERIGREHSFAARASTLLERALRVRASRPGGARPA